jgi:ATP-dependent NAD(P)H-hydrate dehydratase
MVHPYMRQEKNLGADESPEGIADKIIAMLDRLHVLVIGPGLGRDALMQETCARVLVAARERNLAVVLDADGLYLVQTRPELIHGYKECILTPNVVEFQRLAKSQNLNLEHPPPPSAGEDSPSGGKGGGGGGPEEGEEACARLARSFGGVTIIQKGREDIISDGATTLVSSGPGGLKRSGGQGDTLTGCVATFLAWRRAYLEGLWPHGGGLDAAELLALAAFGGSAITRECSRLAFAEKGRSLQAGDLTGFVHEAFLDLLGEKVGGE